MKKKQIAIVLLVIGVVGFIFSQNQKKKYLVFEKRISDNKEFVQKIDVESGNEYLFSVWGTDEETGLQQWAEMELVFKIETFKGEIIEENKIIANESSDDDGGIARAANGDDVRFVADNSNQVTLTTKLIQGDYMDVEVYENLPDNTYWMPVFFILVFIAGSVMFLKARNQ